MIAAFSVQLGSNTSESFLGQRVCQMFKKQKYNVARSEPSWQSLFKSGRASRDHKNSSAGCSQSEASRAAGGQEAAEVCRSIFSLRGDFELDGLNAAS